MKRNASAAVTGMGCICAAGSHVAECMTSLFKEERHVKPPSRFKSTHKAAYPVFEVPDAFLSEALRTKEELHLTSKFGVAAAHEAIRNAEISTGDLAKKRVGVCVGTTVGSSMNDECFYREFSGRRDPDMTPIQRFLRSNPASAIAKEFTLKGPCQTVVNACSSGTDAIGIGLSWIQSGLCDIVLAGGADELCHVTYNGFISLMITDDSPCKPFDKHRKGLNLGEGAGILVLESEDSCKERKGPIRSYILGYGSSTDAYHLTAPHPGGEGLKRALSEVMTSCNVDPAEISFVNAHGTGTVQNDRAEARGLHLVFGERARSLPVSSIKSMVGHCLGAAGAIEAVALALTIARGVIPPTVHHRQTDAECDLDVVPNHARDARVRCGVSTSLAFGGNNSAIVMKRVD